MSVTKEDESHISGTVGARTSHFLHQCKMPISVTISWSYRDRKYNFYLTDVRFLISEVVITQPWTNLSYQNLVIAWVF